MGRYVVIGLVLGELGVAACSLAVLILTGKLIPSLALFTFFSAVNGVYAYYFNSKWKKEVLSG